jgi:hypothetical protein
MKVISHETIFESLGDHGLRSEGIICYPAGIMYGYLEDLVARGLTQQTTMTPFSNTRSLSYEFWLTEKGWAEWTATYDKYPPIF